MLLTFQTGGEDPWSQQAAETIGLQRTAGKCQWGFCEGKPCFTLVRDSRRNKSEKPGSQMHIPVLIFRRSLSAVVIRLIN